MLLKWRGKEYDFENRALPAFKDKDTNADIDAPIFAFDTESVQLTDRYEMICFRFPRRGAANVLYICSRAPARLKFY
jgi:hypothetical protein